MCGALAKTLPSKELRLKLNKELNKTKWILLLSVVLGLIVAAPAQSQQGAMPPGHPPIGQTGSSAGSSSSISKSMSERSVTGTVIETMDASSYTYVQVDTGSRSVWAAAPQFQVRVGDRVTVPTTSPMQNYRSDTLGRTFPLVYFAGNISLAGNASRPAMATDRSSPHPTQSRASRPSALSLAGIAKPNGGTTIGEVYDGGRGLAGSEVAIRGRVVKYSVGIMGTNWMHLQDGTEGKDGSNDLVITTDDMASVGDLVLVRGIVVADRDFGYGYVYSLMVEGARVETE